ncbi:hypothetical protein DLREEDagr8_51730 [Dongia sp. agr-C8]
MRPVFGALIAAMATLCAGAAEAQDAEAICQAIALEANRIGPALGERDIYELSDGLVAAVPAPMRYLEPRQAEPGEVAALIGCADWDSCEAKYGDTFEGLIDDDTWPWWTQIIDTRPSGKELFIFTTHSGIFRSDQFTAFEQQSDKRLKILPLGYDEIERGFDTGYAILLDEAKPYVVVPPSITGFLEVSGYWGTPGTNDLNLTVADPRNATPSCTVTYKTAPRSTVLADSSLAQIEPPPALRSAIRTFLDRNLEEIARKVKLASDLGEIVASNPVFAPSTLASRELERLQARLSNRQALSFLRAQQHALAKAVFSEDWDALQASSKVETWETRWFSVEIARQGYVGLLLRTGYFHFNPKLDTDKSLVALFTWEGDQLNPVAAYEIQSLFHFAGAEVNKDP